jgi:hypothetical protein
MAIAAMSFPFLAALADSSGTVTIGADVVESTPTQGSQPAVVINPAQSLAQATTLITLTGLDPFSYVEVYVQSTPILIASGFADKYGTFKAEAHLPTTLEAGGHSVTAKMQVAGQPPKLITLATFAVSATGGVSASKPVKGGGSGEGGNNGTQTTPSATATPSSSSSPSATSPEFQQSSVGGVLMVGGLLSRQAPGSNFWNPDLQTNITLENTYKAPYNVSISSNLYGMWGIQLADAKTRLLRNLPVSRRTNLVIRNSGVGEFGFYEVDVTVMPEVSVDGQQVQPMTFKSQVFIWPSWLLLVILVLFIWWAAQFLVNQNPVLVRRLKNISIANRLDLRSKNNDDE